MTERAGDEKPLAAPRRCAKCDYDLSGLSRNICPECGTLFDPAAPPHRKRPAWIVVIVATLVVMYAPFGWLFFVQSDPSYVRYWFMLYPILPGLAPTFALSIPFNYPPGKLPEWLAFSIMGAIALGAALLIIWLARRSRRAFIITMIIALAISIFNNVFAHAIFAA